MSAAKFAGMALLAGALVFTSAPNALTVTPARDDQRNTDQPNIVIVLTDDQRAGTEVGLPTVMNELAARGVTYENAVVPTSWCCPSRASLLTGNFSHTTGLWENTSNSPWGAWPAFNAAGLENNTLATALDDAGYRTGLFGKYLNDIKYAGPGYVPPGWDDFEAFLGGNYYRYGLTSDKRPVTGNRRYLTDELADRAVDFITDTPSDEPLFLYFSPFAPHSPFTPGPYEGTSADTIEDVFEATNFPAPTFMQEDLSGKPAWLNKLPITQNWYKSPTEDTGYTIAEVAQRQQDTLMGVDAAVARIITALEQTDRMRDTLIVLTSDNGYSWGEHRTLGKNTPYRSSVDVPLIIRFDGRLPAGVTDDRVTAANVDTAATVLTAAGLAAGDIDGVSLLSSRRRDGVVMEAMRWTGWRNRPAYCGFRTMDSLYVRYRQGKEELYDYTTDPFEQRNQADNPAYSALKDRLKSKTQRACSPVPPEYSWDDEPTPQPTRVTSVIIEDRGSTGRTFHTYRFRWAAPRKVANADITFLLRLKSTSPTKVRTSGGAIAVEDRAVTVCQVSKITQGLSCSLKIRPEDLSNLEVRVDTVFADVGEARGPWQPVIA